MPKLIFVGQRQSSAEAAAERLEWPYFVLHQAPLSRAPLPLEQGRLHTPFQAVKAPELLQHIQSVMPDVDYAIPLTEGAVTLAAALQDCIENSQHKHQNLAESLTHKQKMKAHAQKQGIPCARFLTYGEPIPTDWTYPCIVKTEVGSGSRGMSMVHTPEELAQALQAGYLAESFIVGKEFSVESFISNGNILFTNITDYTEPRWENILPAAFSVDKQQEIRAFNASVIKAFGVQSGMTHLEVFDTQQGLYFGEMARRPPGGYIMDLLSQAYGMEAWIHYLQSFTTQEMRIPNQAKCYVGVRMMHPGAGYISRVSGEQEAQKVSGAHRVKITKKPPVTLTAREGVGESSGYCMATGNSAQQVHNSLSEMTQCIHWHMS